MKQKNILIVVGIIILLALGYMFMNNDASNTPDSLTDIENQLVECQNRLTNWQDNYGDENPLSNEGQSELDSILNDCQEVVNTANDTI